MENQLKMDVKLLLKGDELTKEIMVSLPQDPAKLEKEINETFYSMQALTFYETHVSIIYYESNIYCRVKLPAWNMPVMSLNALLIRVNRALETIELEPYTFDYPTPIEIIDKNRLEYAVIVLEELAEHALHIHNNRKKAEQKMKMEENKSA